LYSLPNIIRTIKSRRVRWMENEVLMEEVINAYRILVAKPERKMPLR
jgi:hypothetical protein